MSAAEVPASRLGADDWVQAAFDIMLTDGIEGVKIQKLCDRLGVTKGSFYWHFTDMQAFQAEVARSWAEQGAKLPSEAAADVQITSMLQAMQLFVDPRNSRLARVMRDWALRDERARKAIKEADERLYDRVTWAFTSLGFTDAEASVRAKILVYAGYGFAFVGPLGERSTDGDELAVTWELLSRR